MEKLLLIAEKPSLMREVNTVYKKNRKSIPYDIDFVALSGHICGYDNPRSYEGWDLKWRDLPIPMIPEKWKISVTPEKMNIYKDISNKLKSTDYDGIICASDADREGNFLYYLAAVKLGIIKKKTYRFWVHDLTDDGIMDAFNNMKDMATDDFQKNLTNASILRSQFDWLIGMNFTVAASVKTNSLMKIGRVKTPTLKIVYDNCNAIDNFKPVTTYEIESVYKEGFSGIYAETRYKTKEEAQKVIDTLGEKAVVESIEKKIVKTSAPQLFKLSSLQIDASKIYGYSPDKTLKLVQSLYEKHKIVSYPRTGCCYISNALTKEFNKLLAPIKVIPELASYVDALKPSDFENVAKDKKYVNDKEVGKSSHTALVPTGKIPNLSDLTEDEKNIMTMIYKRFLAIFLPNLVEEKCVIITKNLNNDLEFKSNGNVMKDAGYTAIYDSKKKDNELPELIKGQEVNVEEFKINDKTTTPPARLTDGTLVKEMENVSKYVDDKELKDVLKESEGIGTEATRAKIIKDLISDGYIETKKAKKALALYITPMGKAYIENLLNFSIVSPELTAEWEKKLKEIEHGELPAKTFKEEMLEFINNVSDEIKNSEMKKSESSFKNGKEPLCVCPKCGKNIYENTKAFSCENKECGCVLFKEDRYLSSLGQKMTKTVAKNFFTKKKSTFKNLKSKAGKEYSANILVDFSGKYPTYKMEFINNKGTTKKK